MNEDQFCAGVTLLWWRRALGGRSTVCCVQYLTIPFVLMHSWNVCSLWRRERERENTQNEVQRNKNDLFMSLRGCRFSNVSGRAVARLPGLFYQPHTHPRTAHLIVTGLYPERQEWLTMADWQVYSSVAFLFLVLTRSPSPRLMTARLGRASQRCAYSFFLFFFLKALNNVASVSLLTWVHVARAQSL